MKDRTQEQTPSAVPERAPQDGEIRARWTWVETEVWTERMLATLETGIEGGKWFRLIDKVWSPKNLGNALEKVVSKGGSAGIDNQSARQIEVHKDQTIAKLEQELRASQYQPQAVKRVWIPKPGSNEKRPLGVPTLRARLKRCARAFFPVTLSRWNAADRTTVISPMPNGAACSRPQTRRASRQTHSA